MARKKANPEQVQPVKVAPLPIELVSAGPTDAAADLASVLIFTVGAERFSIGVEHTEGVVDCPRITPLPWSPNGIMGVASVRGRMTLVMELSEPTSDAPAKRRLILLKGEAQLALIADHVEDILGLDRDQHLAAEDKRFVQNGRGRESWPVKFYFKNNGRAVPVIDVERLSE